MACDPTRSAIKIRQGDAARLLEAITVICTGQMAKMGVAVTRNMRLD